MAVFSPHLKLWIEAFLYASRGVTPIVPRTDTRVLEDLAPEYDRVQQPDFTAHEEISAWFQSASWQSRFLTLAGEQSRMIGGASESFTVPDSAADICKKYVRQFAEIMRAHLEPAGSYYLTAWGMPLVEVRELQTGSPQSLTVASGSSDEQWWTTPQYSSPRASQITYSRRFSADTAWLSTLTCAELFAEDRPEEIVDDLQTAADALEGDKARRIHHTWSNTDDLPVYQISSGTDFTDLTARFPLKLRTDIGHILRDPNTIGAPIDVIPDWSRVAQHYSGIFLESEAFLAHTWVPLHTPYGVTVMTGWAPETFYRLR